MTPQQDKFQRRVEEALKAGRLTIIIGAGVSINAISTSTRGDNNNRARALESMSWYGLLRHGLSYLDEEQVPLDTSERTELATLTTAFGSNLPSPIDQEMFRAATLIKQKLKQSRKIDNWFDLEFEAVYDDFINHEKNPMLDSIAALYKCGARIVTTNYDDLMDRHINEKPILGDETPALMRFFRKEVTGICHIHGVWWHTRGAIFDDLDYERVQQDDRIQQCLRNSMTSDEVLLFVGTGDGLRDPNFGKLLSWAAKWNDGRAQRHCLLANHQEHIDNQAHGLNVIRYGQSFQDLPGFLDNLAKNGPRTQSIHVFEFSMADSTSDELVTSRIISYPRRKVAYFVPRREQVERLQKALPTDNTPNSRDIDATAVLTGIGGCGKTQLALDFCELAESALNYHSIIWIDASSRVAAEQAFTAVAEKIPGIQHNFTDVDQKVHAVLDYISHSNVRWLLVFDNFDDPSQFPGDDIRGFWPRQRQNCSILITSRNTVTSDLSLGRSHIDMTRMNEDEALSLLQNSGDDPEPSQSARRQVVQRLGYHALAIDQACFIIQRSGRSTEDFLRLYEREKRIFNQVSDFSVYKRKLSPSAQETVLNAFTTLKLSWDLIQDDSTTKADKQHLMVLLSFFNGTCIPSSLFEGYNEENESWLKSCYQDGEWNMMLFEEIFQTLCRISLAQLLKTDDHGIKITVHPLVQDWAKFYLSTKAEYPRFIVQSIQILGHALQQPDKLSLEKRLLMLSHAETISISRSTYLSNYKFDSLSVLAIENMSELYSAQGEYTKAKMNAALVLQERQRDLGPEHQDTLRSLNDLGVIHIQLGNADDSEPLFKRLIEVNERVFGSEHLSTLNNQNNLALTYRNQGRWEEAEELFVQIIEIEKRMLGPEHPSTLSCQNNLAVTYRDQGQWKNAEELFVQVAETTKRVFGPEHPNTLTTQANLASSYQPQGRWKEAEELEVQVMNTRKRVLGQDHPDTLISMNNLAHTLRDQGRDDEATSLLESCADLCLRVLGRKHPNTEDVLWTMRRWQKSAHVDEEQENDLLASMPGGWVD